jgi:hypothetical protein
VVNVSSDLDLCADGICGSSGKVGEKQIKFFLWEKRHGESIRKGFFPGKCIEVPKVSKIS